MKHFCKSGLITALLVSAAISGCAGPSSLAGDRQFPAPTNTPVVAAQGYFETTDDLKYAWHDLPARFIEGTIGNKHFIVVAFDPYSGMPSVDIYCYIADAQSHGWLRRAVAWLGPDFNAAGSQNISAKSHDDTLEIWRDGSLRLSINIAIQDRREPT